MTAQPCVIILAAGLGQRFQASGGTENKLDALLSGRPVRDHVLAAVQASELPYHLVERAHTAHMHNPGMADSIATGVAATPEAQGWLILPADLPLIQPETLRVIAQALQAHPIVVPFYQGTQGHPVGFQSQFGSALRQLSGDQGARALLKQHGFARCDVVDEGCIRDVDTVEALAHAQAHMRGTR